MYWDRLWLTFVSHSSIDRGRLYDVCTSCPSLSTRLRLWLLLTPGIWRRVPWQMYGPREPAAYVVKVNRGNIHRHPNKTWSFAYELGLFCHGTNDADFMLTGAYTPLDFWDTLFGVFHNQATKSASTCLHSDWSPFLRILEPDTLPRNTAQ